MLAGAHDRARATRKAHVAGVEGFPENFGRHGISFVSAGRTRLHVRTVAAVWRDLRAARFHRTSRIRDPRAYRGQAAAGAGADRRYPKLAGEARRPPPYRSRVSPSPRVRA